MFFEITIKKKVSAAALVRMIKSVSPSLLGFHGVPQSWCVGTLCILQCGGVGRGLIEGVWGTGVGAESHERVKLSQVSEFLLFLTWD